MAKEKKSKYAKMDGYDKYRAMNEMAEFYGVEGVRGPGYRGSVSGRPGANYGDEGRDTSVRRNDHEGFGRALNDKMANGAVADYLRYSGGSLPHANDMEGMYNLHQEMRKAHEKNPDGDTGGAFNNASDVAALAQRTFTSWKDKFKEELLAGMPKQEEQPSEQTPGALKPDPVLSERMQQSQDYVNQYKFKVRNGDITEAITGNKPSDLLFDTRPQELGSEMSDMPCGAGIEDIKQDSPLDNTASQVFSDKYKLGLKDTMKKNGIPTRGPGLLATMQLPLV